MASSQYVASNYQSQNGQGETNDRNQVSYDKSQYTPYGSHFKTSHVETDNGKYNTAASNVVTNNYQGQTGQSRINDLKSNYFHNQGVTANGGATSTLNVATKKGEQGAATNTVVTSTFAGTSGQSSINKKKSQFFNQIISSPYGTDESITNAHSVKQQQGASASQRVTSSYAGAHGESFIKNKDKKFDHTVTSETDGSAKSVLNVLTKKATQRAATAKVITPSYAGENGQNLVKTGKSAYYSVKQVSAGGTAQNILNVQTQTNKQAAAISKVVTSQLQATNGQSLTKSKVQKIYNTKYSSPDGSAGETFNRQTHEGTHGVASSKQITANSAEQNAQSQVVSAENKEYHMLVYG